MGVRKVVEKGMMWCVGNGRSVAIWEDAWIPNATGGRVISARPDNCNLRKVSELIDHKRRCWNYAVVKQVFQPWEATQVLQIPVYQGDSRDRRIWRAERRGLFTVKSAYKIACSMRREGAAKAESGRAKEDRGRMWRQVWKLYVKPKLKHFL